MAKYSSILFDLDGNLLPMDMDNFIKLYFGALAQYMASYGFEPKEFIDGIWAGTKAMIKNDGKNTNESVFWNKFAQFFGKNARETEPYFENFYLQDFEKVKVSCGFTPKAKETVDKIKGLGLKIALATNPIFPAIATRKRIAWAGLSPDDFELYTTYENSRFCKPNVEYYKDIIKVLGVKAEECLMVGNDVTEDMVAQTLGMKVFLLTDCLINKNPEGISVYPNGDFDKLYEYVKKIIK